VFATAEEEEEEEVHELKQRCRELKTFKWARAVICFTGAATNPRRSVYTCGLCLTKLLEAMLERSHSEPRLVPLPTRHVFDLISVCGPVFEKAYNSITTLRKLTPSFCFL
jgi:hypothetical protein